MRKVDEYRVVLRTLDDWDAYLRQNSGLPGPRANLELLAAVVEEGSAELFHRYQAYGPDAAPGDSPAGFLAVCGVAGLGRLLADGDDGAIVTLLRQHANDPRWRVREAVCIALQRFGQHDPGALLTAVAGWPDGTLLERRAVAAALCEPALLTDERVARRALAILDQITASLLSVEDTRSEDFQVLQKGLSYCWSVAVAALPSVGQPLFERWLASDHPAIRRIVKANLKKKRLAQLDTAWVERCLARLEAAG